ncbi:glucokinase regulatory protein isoform X2 [Syngnathoides biaculeatus]|uniref:glucokinase regulatory protein isoform X2 n=1 Tax=Syngnathoides biaculeatus TaxID=300417 RepID=UPI002ADE40D7|nr:glucokinase regulatory protein isoform X2 [Syngnathoides biaculeatus]
MHEWESPDYEPSLPVSEKSNPLTRDIDQASPGRIVRMLQSCDAEMFLKGTGSTYKMLLSDKVMKTMMGVAEEVEVILKEPLDSLVVLSGCGTSGRLAFLVASGFNNMLKEVNHSEVYEYIIAGGDRALFSSQEAPEDDPHLGMLCLKKACEGKKRVLFIGISCGLSAPFVAGQLDFCLRHLEVFTPVLLGFNPAHQARNEPVRGCPFTFLNVVQRMQALAKSRRAFLINPSVGPEAISGSSRMKGGSATKMLLEVILCAAHAAVFSHEAATHQAILQHLRAYEKSVAVTYSHSTAIAGLVAAAGQSLLSKKHVCYLGWGSLAVLGLIDASECEPTFGAAQGDIQGFISGGYRALNNNEGSIALMVYVKDTVILIYNDTDNIAEVMNIAYRVREKMSNLYAIYHQADGDDAGLHEEINRLYKSTLTLSWPLPTFGKIQHMWELSTKLVLNAVSTGAHILKGKVYQNHMIDLQVTNSKLYRRATRLIQCSTSNSHCLSPKSRCFLTSIGCCLSLLVWRCFARSCHVFLIGFCFPIGTLLEDYGLSGPLGILALGVLACPLNCSAEKLSGHPEAQCEEALLKVIYKLDRLPEDIISCHMTTHTASGMERTKVVPLTLVSLLTGCSFDDAKSHLDQEPIIRKAVEACLQSRPRYEIKQQI